MAKAPRKQLAPVRSVTSPSTGKSKKCKLLVGGNPAKAWPTPTWQKGIQTFLGGGSSSGGECSSSSATNSGSSDTEEQPMSTVDFISEQSSNSTEQCPGACGGVSLLDGDITQLNSDEDGD